MLLTHVVEAVVYLGAVPFRGQYHVHEDFRNLQARVLFPDEFLLAVSIIFQMEVDQACP